MKFLPPNKMDSNEAILKWVLKWKNPLPEKGGTEKNHNSQVIQRHRYILSLHR